MQLDEFLERSAERRPEKTALIAGRERWSYGEVAARATRLAAVLIAAGVCRGDRVAILLGNSAETVVAIFAALEAGAAFVPIHPTTKREKLAFLLADSGARALFVPASRLPEIEDLLLAGLPTLRAVLAAGPMPESVPSPSRAEIFSVDRILLEKGHPAPRQRSGIDEDLAALIYTSGTTRDPKGVMLSHLNMVSAATSINTYLENTAEDVILDVLPLSFDYGLYQVLMAFQVGATVIVDQPFVYPNTVLRRIRDEGVTAFPIVPTILAILLPMALERFDLSSLRYISNTGAALPVATIREVRRRLPSVRIFSMYGLTECKRVAYLPPTEIDRKPGSVGRAMPNTEAWVVDDEGRPLPAGVEGELVVRGSNVMLGYWGRPEETERVLRSGTWIPSGKALPGQRVLHTGDVFRTDEEGLLYFVGRKDDIIKSRGEKISPREVEEVLHALGGVAEAKVIGVPDVILGQAVKAFVVPRPGVSLKRREVLRHCAGHLEDLMVPKTVEICARLPRTANGKIAQNISEAA